MKKHHFLASLAAYLLCSGIINASENTAGRRIGALPDSLWTYSEWISVADAPVVTGRVDDGARAADGASWFVASFTNKKKIKSVKWMTAGLGVYDLYVNGKLIGEEVLKPGFTHPEKTKRSFTYDVTDAVTTKKGAENTFSVEVVPGWWADKIVTHGGHDGMVGRKVAFRGVIEITYNDGSKEYIGTDTSGWKAGIAGPVTHSAIFDGVDFDARRQPGFMTADAMAAPEVNNEFCGEILPSAGAEIYQRFDLALPPVEAYIWKTTSGADGDNYGKVVVDRSFAPGDEMTVRPGETLVIDFGQNAAAVPVFEFKAKSGTRLTCLPGELLNANNGARSKGMDGPEGSVHRLNLRIPDTGMILNYTFDDTDDFVTFIPRSTFFGYRYASVTADDDVVIRSVSSVPVTSISKDMETGCITTGNDLVNKLISNTIWGQRSNYLSVPTDCPQRNERLGWTADTQVFSETGTFFADTKDFFHKWMRDMRDTQNAAGSFPGVAPVAQYGADPSDYCRLGWSDAGIIVPWVVWKQFGDTAIVNENWDAMVKYITHLNDTRYRHTDLTAENGNYQWADWLSYEPLESCGGGIFMTDENGHTVVRPEAIDYWNYLSACYWLSNAEMMRDMASATGRNPAVFAQMADRARNYIRDEFLTSDGRFNNEILNTMQTPALFALRNSLVDGKAKDEMIRRLRQNFADHGNCLQTGFLGTSILMPTLSENGMTDIAYELLLQRNNPSWLYSVDNGATTIWERWNSYMKEQGMGPQGMNSFNHYAYGCVCEWIWETAAGIAADPSAPGFRHIIMKPVPDRRLSSLDASYRTPFGTVESHWHYEGDNWVWNFTVPEGTTASVTLPGTTVAEEYAPGDYTVSRKLF